jgi:hypothetical protein
MDGGFVMVYNPKLVEELLGKEVSELFDGTIKVEPSNGEVYGNLKVGDKLTFTFKENNNVTPRQFIVK